MAGIHTIALNHEDTGRHGLREQLIILAEVESFLELNQRHYMELRGVGLSVRLPARHFCSIGLFSGFKVLETRDSACADIRAIDDPSVDGRDISLIKNFASSFSHEHYGIEITILTKNVIDEWYEPAIQTIVRSGRGRFWFTASARSGLGFFACHEV
jgi:hypothetical protein